jgi:hypothetical protein
MRLMLAGLLLISPFALPSRAQMLCDCCGNRPLADTCVKACAGATSDSGTSLCRPVILPDVRDRARRNPLAGPDLKYLDLTGLSPRQLERVRRWAEKWRARAERRFRRIRARARRGRVNAEAFARAEARRDAVVVNYQHVIRAYRAAHAARRPR